MGKKAFIALVATTVVLFGAVILFRVQNIGSTFIWNISDGGKILLPLVTVAALIDSINPCAFSILLLTIAFLVSIGGTKRKILAVGGSYIAGLFAAYILIGLGILQALHIFSTPHFMAKVGAAALIAFGGVNLINYFFPAFPIKFQIPQGAHRRMALLMEQSSLPAAFFLGGLVGLCEFPCTGGPYLLILGLLHDTGTYARGLGYLVLYNLLFILPLVLILLIASNRVLLERVQAWKRREIGRMRLVTGIAMVALGILIFFL